MASLPEREQPVLRIVPMPADTNAHGTIFGGWVMSQVDVAGSIPAWERAHGRIVTVDVEVFAERRREGRKQVVRVTEAQLTYVAVDDQRRPRVVPPGDGLVEV